MTKETDELGNELTALRKINQVLMERVENSVNNSGSDYSIFEQNILLQKHIDERTSDLEDANKRLEELLAENKNNQNLLRAAGKRAVLQREAIARLVLDNAVVNTDIDAALKRITLVMAEAFDVKRVGIWTLEDEGSLLLCCSLYEADSKRHSEGLTLKRSDFPEFFQAIFSENRIYAEEVLTDPRTRELTHKYLIPLGINSLLAAGIIVDGELKGVICIEHTGPPRKWQPDEESFSGTAASLTAQIFTSHERRKAESALYESEEKLRRLVDVSPYSIQLLDKNGYTIRANKSHFRLFGAVPPQDYSVFNDPFLKSLGLLKDMHRIRKGETVSFPEFYYNVHEVFPELPDNPVWLRMIGFPLLNSRGKVENIVLMHEDITEQKKAEEEKKKLQSQLAQSHKMESVGRLAGGVAHDFNNMLGVILGHAEMVLMRIKPDDDLYADIIEIENAAKRSAELTRRLLAFARKQTITPVVMDMNETIEGMINMLRRLIGEDIELKWLPDMSIKPVMIDPSQADQIMANLCVNARDAISGIGRITIETGNTSFDHDYCIDHPGYIPGDYVMVAVSDNGCGMDSDTLSKLFEPFFTTKKPGEGTGLGLAMIYGIVKQNGGFINVYSEPSEGTVFKMYLPVYEGKSADKNVKKNTLKHSAGTETILIVEDEPMILKLAKTMLEQAGYPVLCASTPGEAIEIAEKHEGEIDLLITDVIMPEMNGRELAKRILSIYPKVKRLFMSGYTANVIAHHGVLDFGMHFLQKPFSLKELTEKTREALES